MTGDTHDRWALGDAYDAYMGRWSRLVAREFVDWLRTSPGEHWLEIGCGTGALTSTLCAHTDPASVVACDASASFVEHARTRVADPRASFVAAAADSLPSRPGGFDRIVSGLVLNFIPDPGAALVAMKDRVRSGGVVSAYLWDYLGGIEFLSHFWSEAVAADPEAAQLDEAQRFANWNLDHVASLFRGAGLADVTVAPLTVPTAFASFDDYWAPFLGGTGPAPTYVATLSDPKRDALAERLRTTLPRAADGRIVLHARALAARGLRA
ncbi:MAG: methyltransferase domain-containing protein [bacterium]